MVSGTEILLAWGSGAVEKVEPDYTGQRMHNITPMANATVWIVLIVVKPRVRSNHVQPRGPRCRQPAMAHRGDVIADV